MLKMIRLRQHSDRTGAANPMWILLLGAAVLIIVLTLLLMQNAPQAPEGTAGLSEDQPLIMYCAAGLRTPVEKIVGMYEKEYGVKVSLQFGGSNSLLNQIEVNQYDHADLFLAADEIYVQQAVQKKLAVETLPVAGMRLVLAVKAGNPLKIHSIDDLYAKPITLSVPSPEQAAAGMAAKACLSEIKHEGGSRWTQLEALATESGVFKPTVNDVATDVSIGAADAGLIWDFLVRSPAFRDELQAVTLPELEGAVGTISLAVLSRSSRPTEALKFGRYLTAGDRGLPIFAEGGMTTIRGDVWVEHPTITFFCGAVNRRAVDAVIEEFSSREGVTVNTVYDGCGTLTGRMRTIDGQSQNKGFPDIYMACDLYHLTNVGGWFQDAVQVSSAEIVIAVPKGSQKVSELKDLLKPGIRVSIGQPEQCTIGLLTRNLLQSEGLLEELKQKQSQPGEVVVEKPSSALLVPDVLTGHADAAVAYITDVLASSDKVDIIRIKSELNRAVQPVGVARTSDHKNLVSRLKQKIAEARSAFETAGFRYQYDPGDEWTAGDQTPITADKVKEASGRQ